VKTIYYQYDKIACEFPSNRYNQYRDQKAPAHRRGFLVSVSDQETFATNKFSPERGVQTP
jgi:hypothetical protein